MDLSAAGSSCDVDGGGGDARNARGEPRMDQLAGRFSRCLGSVIARVIGDVLTVRLIRFSSHSDVLEDSPEIGNKHS